MKLLRTILLAILIFPVFSVKSQIYLSEGFETGSRPDEWTEETVVGNEPWRFRNGGHSPNDNNWLVPPDAYDITRNPPAAYEGTYNAIFFKQGNNNERTKLITPELNLMGGASVELSFYLCQVPWTFEGSTGWDILRVYYRVSQADSWVLLHEYLDPIYEWEKQSLVLPNISSSYQVAFEAQTRWGYGTCVDNVLIEETGLQPMYIGEIDFEQPFSHNIPSGSSDVPILRMDFKVYGNSDSVLLDYINFRSLNTSDGDIQPNGVKIYSTTNQQFTTDNPLGAPTNFVSGVASFNNLNHTLPPGQSYLWLAYDVDINAGHGNILDVKVSANDIKANDSFYPASEQSPFGDKTVFETIYKQDFEGVHNWTLTGEFEVGSPNGSGGILGNPNPSYAFSGTKSLGTDITGLGVHPYHYENDLNELASYKASSPNIDAFFYKSLNIFFQRYLNIEVWDNSSIQISSDNGTTWNTVWESTSYLSDFQWAQFQIPIPNEYSRSENIKIRYQLGTTDAQNNYTGWNIDDVYLTGEFISKDVGVTDWIYPLSGSGHSVSDSVTVRIENFGGANITDPVPLAYSFDGGAIWVIDIMTQNIPIGGSVLFTFPTKVDLSTPGLRPSVMAKTILPGDQYEDNDQISTQLYIVPTYTPPYFENFESNNGYFRGIGNNIWEYGVPAGAVIDSSSSGTQSWVTGLDQEYDGLVSQKNQIVFEDDFEVNKPWIFSGEFERNIPSNMYLPYFAYSGLYCIGTDLSGQGSNPYYYENGITSGNSFSAVSPAIDVSSYSNLNLTYESWLTIQAGDSVKVEVSTDNGAHWQRLWQNSEGGIMDVDYQFHQILIPDSMSHSTAMRFRFSLFQSSSSGPVAEGWNIDDIILYGDLVNNAPGYLTSPSYDLSGILNPVFETKLWLDTEQDVDGATLEYSLNDGSTWSSITNSSGFDAYWNWFTGNPVSALEANGWSGQSGGWLTARHILPAEVIGQENIQLRFKFAANKINNNYDGIAVDDIRIIEAPHDIGVLDIMDPVSACELSANQTFTVRLKNYGISSLQSGDSIQIGYKIDRSGMIQEAEESIYLSQPFAVGATKDFTLSTEFDFSVGGEYNLDVFTIEPDPYFYYETANDTLSKAIRVNKPVVELGPNISTVRPDTIVLEAFSGVSSQNYLWQDDSTDSIFHVSSEGTYFVRVTNDLGCMTSDTVKVMQLIPDVGIIELVSPLSACEYGIQVPINIIIENSGTDTIYKNEPLYLLGDINMMPVLRDTIILNENFIPGATIDYTYSETFDFSTPGTYQLELSIAYGEDFVNDNDSINYALEVYGYPDIDLGPDIIASIPEYVLQATPGYFEYLWQDGSTNYSFTVNQPGHGLYSVIVSDDNQCITKDSVNVTLNVTDIALDQLLSPASSCDLAESITVSARISNTGNLIIPANETINMAYMINGGALVQEAILLTSDFLPGSSIDYAFSQTETVQSGEWYEFTVYLDYPNDIKPWNDTIVMPLGVFETLDLDLGEDYQVITKTEHILDAGPGFVSYEWQDGSTSQTFVVSEPGINVYGVTVTNVNGCTAYDEVEIMLAVPDIGISEIVHPTTTCSLGTDENVKVMIRNFGNWDIEASSVITVSYTINGSQAVSEDIVLGAIFENGSELVHTFSNTEDLSLPDTYDIIVNVTYVSDLIPSNNTLNANIEVLGSPIVDIGNGEDTILVYNPLTLSAKAGYASYLWQDGSTSTVYSINSPGAGLYSVLVTGDNGCTTFDSVYVAYDYPDLALSQIVSPVSSCQIGQNDLVSIEIVNNGYYWISGSEPINITYSVNNGTPVSEIITFGSNLQPGQSKVVNFSASYDFTGIGSYQLNVNLDYAADEVLTNNALSRDIEIWENPVVEIGNGLDTIIASVPLTLDAGAGYSSYLWQDNSTESTFVVSQYGLHRVRVTNEVGCSAYDSVHVESPLSVNNQLINKDQIKIFPNPAYDFLNVEVDLEMEMEVLIELFSILNTTVYREDLRRVSRFERRLDVQGLTPGTYVLRIIADGIPHTSLVIIK